MIIIKTTKIHFVEITSCSVSSPLILAVATTKRSTGSRIVTSPSGDRRKHIIVLLSTALGWLVYSNLAILPLIYIIILLYDILIDIIFLLNRYYIFFERFVLYTVKTPSSAITSFRGGEFFLIICLFFINL